MASLACPSAEHPCHCAAQNRQQNQLAINNYMTEMLDQVQTHPPLSDLVLIVHTAARSSAFAAWPTDCPPDLQALAGAWREWKLENANAWGKWKQHWRAIASEEQIAYNSTHG